MQGKVIGKIPNQTNGDRRNYDPAECLDGQYISSVQSHWTPPFHKSINYRLCFVKNMRFDIITIFPRIFDSYLDESILKRAIKNKLVEVRVHNLRDFTKDRHKKVALRGAQGDFALRCKIDDKPYGGGAGMVLMAEPILRAVSQSVSYRFIGSKSKKLKNRKTDKPKTKIIILSAKGKQFNQKMAYDWARKLDRIVLISGRYEGIDERVKLALKQRAKGKGQNVLVEEVSIGPYVLTDGDAAAMVIISAITRLLPDVINWESLKEESYFSSLVKKEKDVKDGKNLEYPHYTRPEIFKWSGKNYRAPKVLLSGNHKKIAAWREASQRVSSRGPRSGEAKMVKME